jgi:ribosomal protein S18 acetylase RimI-like enzyme
MMYDSLDEIVKIHKEQFQKYDVLSSCSADTVKLFYEKVIREDRTIILTEIINGRTAGFLYLTLGKPTQIKEFLKAARFKILSSTGCYPQLIKSLLNRLLVHNSYEYENELIYVAVLEKYSGMGIGTKLIKRCEEELKKRMVKEYYLQVLKKNTRAVNLYRTLGFKIVKRVSRIGGEKLIMKKEII